MPKKNRQNNHTEDDYLADVEKSLNNREYHEIIVKKDESENFEKSKKVAHDYYICSKKNNIKKGNVKKNNNRTFTEYESSNYDD